MAGDEKKENAREELHEADESQVERALSDFVDLPRDRDGLHLHGNNHARASSLKEQEIWMVESGAAVGSRGVFGFGHQQILCHKKKIATRTMTIAIPRQLGRNS
jgi:hypothetical protein